MEDIIIYIMLQMLQKAIDEAVDKAIDWVIKKVVDEAGKVVTQIVYEFDSDGDGINDSEEVLFTIDTLIPDINDGYCICNRDNEIGLGIPMFEVVDGTEIGGYIEDTTFSGNGGGVLVDYDYDGHWDDVLIPLPYDVTGDGVNDWGWLVDDDDNGLPDVSPSAPFYPVGSDGYNEIIKASGRGEQGILDKPLDDYTVTEGLLLCIFLISLIYFIKSLFRRKDIYR